MGLGSRSAVSPPVEVVPCTRRPLVPVVAWLALAVVAAGCPRADEYTIDIHFTGGGDGTVRTFQGDCVKTGATVTGTCRLTDYRSLQGKLLEAVPATGSTFGEWLYRVLVCQPGTSETSCALNEDGSHGGSPSMVTVRFEGEARVEVAVDKVAGPYDVSVAVYVDDTGDLWCEPFQFVYVPSDSLLRPLSKSWSDCLASWTRATPVTLKTIFKVTRTGTAISVPAHLEWSGPCTGASPTCTFTAPVGTTQVSAKVVLDTPDLSPLTVLGGGGDGKVTSEPPGIDCAFLGPGAGTGSCTADLPSYLPVTLTAHPAAGFELRKFESMPLTGFHCTGPSCTFTPLPGEAWTATPTFAPTSIPTRLLTVEGATTLTAGRGTVTASAGAIACLLTGATVGTGTCAANLPQGTVVTLTATPEAGSTRASWSVTPAPATACAGATCAVTLDADTTVRMGFELLPTVRLTVDGGPAGTRAGAVTSDLGGIDCVPLGYRVEGTCTADVAPGTVVTLTVTPDAGYGFTSLTFAPAAPDCTSSPCPITVSADTTATVTFTATPALTQLVSLTGPMPAGTGGEVTVVSGGGTCDNTGFGSCTFPTTIYAPCWCQTPAGNTLLLRATAFPGNTFTGFTAGCTSTAPSPVGVTPAGVDCTVDPTAAVVSGQLTRP